MGWEPAIDCVSGVPSSSGPNYTAVGCAASIAWIPAMVGTLLSGATSNAVVGTRTISMWLPANTRLRRRPTLRHPKWMHRRGGWHIEWGEAE